MPAEAADVQARPAGHRTRAEQEPGQVGRRDVPVTASPPTRWCRSASSTASRTSSCRCCSEQAVAGAVRAGGDRPVDGGVGPVRGRCRRSGSSPGAAGRRRRRGTRRACRSASAAGRATPAPASDASSIGASSAPAWRPSNELAQRHLGLEHEPHGQPPDQPRRSRRPRRSAVSAGAADSPDVGVDDLQGVSGRRTITGPASVARPQPRPGVARGRRRTVQLAAKVSQRSRLVERVDAEVEHVADHRLGHEVGAEHRGHQRGLQPEARERAPSCRWRGSASAASCSGSGLPELRPSGSPPIPPGISTSRGTSSPAEDHVEGDVDRPGRRGTGRRRPDCAAGDELLRGPIAQRPEELQVRHRQQPADLEGGGVADVLAPVRADPAGLIGDVVRLAGGVAGDLGRGERAAVPGLADVAAPVGVRDRPRGRWRLTGTTRARGSSIGAVPSSPTSRWFM